MCYNVYFDETCIDLYVGCFKSHRDLANHLSSYHDNVGVKNITTYPYDESFTFGCVKILLNNNELYFFQYHTIEKNKFSEDFLRENELI